MVLFQLSRKRHLNDGSPDITKRLRVIKSMKEVVYKDAQNNIEKAQAHQKKNYDVRHSVPMFAKGDLVLWKNMANTHRMGGKLDPKWLGPYKVEEITDKGLYRLQCQKSGRILKQVISSLQLKPYVERLAQLASSLAYAILNEQHSNCYFYYRMKQGLAKNRQFVSRIKEV